MKYIYYIIAIMIVFSGIAMVGLFDTNVEISKPYLSINDRIISQNEFDKLLEKKPSYMNTAHFEETLIEKQILIQEAIKMNINKEESFRRSVENFYEQSLIKILLDRKLESLIVDVTNDELSKYEDYIQQSFLITKTMYPSHKDYQNRTHQSIEKIEAGFLDLSDDLKYIILHLTPGESSLPLSADFGILVYTLDKINKLKKTDGMKEFDIKGASLFLEEKKKEALMQNWTEQIRDNADIWRRNE